MNQRAHAFTMIELLLALVLTSLLTAALSMMIGQAARDRQAMQEQVQAPPWAFSAVNLLERDLQHAQWWAAGDDRLILIGLGHEQLPSRIEYRWRQGDSITSWSRQQTLLTARSRPEHVGDERFVAINLSGIAIGLHTFGEMGGELIEPSVVARSAGDSPSGASVVINGTHYPLQALPDRIVIQLVYQKDQSAMIEREVVLY